MLRRLKSTGSRPEGKAADEGAACASMDAAAAFDIDFANFPSPGNPAHGTLHQMPMAWEHLVQSMDGPPEYSMPYGACGSPHGADTTDATHITLCLGTPSVLRVRTTVSHTLYVWQYIYIYIYCGNCTIVM